MTNQINELPDRYHWIPWIYETRASNNLYTGTVGQDMQNSNVRTTIKYSCKSCQFWSYRKSHLTRHTLTHQLKCPLCEKKLSNSFNLERHKRIFHMIPTNNDVPNV
ncbi:C2H2-type zinc finger transcription factor [Phycomyces blakesleeanus]|uniref:C2H2-type zinc finger transcription factor n=2 Tax=Phycomyces blakesleeanus TaxID=4837 RepID=A0A162YKU7_PHYB8|nr:C2H2-type zinc finger transcription factor [Phycomyces blakesleeanus NRRL 1555(-)]OAD81385.1 C2H2-type zinc finger transcription factor [Phycomyces blakesleeanus NRRL 1555(-)]|eukprot:XP_018299425.1 C2H2-type zinc finger transcription factor [Phycomyces blakesleeanus NRRL 1555(-)]